MLLNTSDDCTGTRAYLVAFVWVGSQRFKDADCVSVGGSNLKIKSRVPNSANPHHQRMEKHGLCTTEAGTQRARNKR